MKGQAVLGHGRLRGILLAVQQAFTGGTHPEQMLVVDPVGPRLDRDAGIGIDHYRAIRMGAVLTGLEPRPAGAGIVADSVPQSEWIETQNKARALLRAAEMAESGLDSRID